MFFDRIRSSNKGLLAAVVVTAALTFIGGFAVGRTGTTTAEGLVGPEPGSQDFSVFVVGLNDVGPDDNIDSQSFDTATGWDFGDRFHYKCAAIEHFTNGVLDFQLDIERVAAVPDKPGNYVKISDQGGKESEGHGTTLSCGHGTAPLAWDGTDHFPHHTHMHFFRDGAEFETLELHRPDCAKGYWTPGDEAGEAWLWWDADGPEHTHPGSPPLDCGGLGAEPVAVARAFVSFRAPGVGVCTHDDLDGSLCVGLPEPTPTPTPTVTETPPPTTPPPTTPPPTTPPPTPTPTPTPPPTFSTVGYVGCSNTAGAVDGYHLDGGTKMWPFIRNYGGGTTNRWANEIDEAGSQYWSAFNKQQGLHPASVFWFQLCYKAAENQNNDDDAREVIAEIQSRVPGATVYISALNGFVAPHVCVIAGANGPANTAIDAAEVVTSGEALAGPNVGSLISNYPPKSAGANAQNNQTTNDGCHPNTAGKHFLGAPLLGFFG